MLPKHSHQEIVNENVPHGGSHTVEVSTHSESIRLATFVRSISGTLTIQIYSVLEDSEESRLVGSALLANAGSEYVEIPIAAGFNKLRIDILHSGAVNYCLVARATNLGPSEVLLSNLPNKQDLEVSRELEKMHASALCSQHTEMMKVLHNINTMLIVMMGDNIDSGE